MNAPLDHTTYEAWLLDRSEGLLTPEEERALDAFLLLNPHLAPDGRTLPSVPTILASLDALDKQALKRSIPPAGLVSPTTVEDHLIARLEGDLDQHQVDALRAFLTAHPEWQHADRTYALTKLVPEAVAFASKRELQRHFPPQGLPTLHTLDDHLIARLEGDLTPTQARALDELLKVHETRQRDWALIQATRVDASTIHFPAKEVLKKRAGRVLPIAFGSRYVRLAAAASVAILLAVGLWFLRAPDAPEQRMARVTNRAVPEPKNSGAPPSKIEVGPSNPLSGTTGTAPEEGGAAQVVQPGAQAPSGSKQRTTSPGLIPVRSHEPPSTEPRDPLMAEDPAPANNASVIPALGTLPEEEGIEELAVVPAVAGDVMVASGSDVRTLGDVLTGALRERVLNEPERSASPLDGEDAVAAVDRTLKVVAGAHAGLDLERKAKGGINSFHLRLGRNLSISASR
ncbi:MAG: hypothetical protein ACO1NQ_12440 [Flavobacteriales bacterium]